MYMILMRNIGHVHEDITDVIQCTAYIQAQVSFVAKEVVAFDSFRPKISLSICTGDVL